jgi:hypothetical protein
MAIATDCGSSFALRLSPHGPLGQAQQSRRFRSAEMKRCFERGQIIPADRPLFVGHHLQGIGAIIEAVFPFDATAKVGNVNLSEYRWLIEKHPKMPRPMHKTG